MNIVSGGERPTPVPVNSDTPMILVVGSKSAWEAEGRHVPEINRMAFASFAEITSALLRDVRPSIVLSTLIAEHFDALDLAACLARLKFKGRYRAVTTTLPNPVAIRQEIQSHAEGLDFDFLVIDPI